MQQSNTDKSPVQYYYQKYTKNKGIKLGNGHINCKNESTECRVPSFTTTILNKIGIALLNIATEKE